MLAWLSLALLFAAPTQKSAPAPTVFQGRVVPALDALRERGIEADPEPLAAQFVLLGEDGQVHPLISDPASRALFLDERLRGRPLEALAISRKGLPFIQITSFRVLDEEGRLRTPEYYCDICTISVRFPQVCPCCQGAMELRFKPDEP